MHPPLRECRALSRGLGVRRVPLEAKSHTQGWEWGSRPRLRGGRGGGWWRQPSPSFPTPPSACPLEVRSPVRVERLRSLATAWVWFTVGRKAS